MFTATTNLRFRRTVLDAVDLAVAFATLESYAVPGSSRAERSTPARAGADRSARTPLSALTKPAGGEVPSWLELIPAQQTAPTATSTPRAGRPFDRSAAPRTDRSATPRTDRAAGGSFDRSAAPRTDRSAAPRADRAVQRVPLDAGGRPVKRASLDGSGRSGRAAGRSRRPGQVRAAQLCLTPLDALSRPEPPRHRRGERKAAG